MESAPRSSRRAGALLAMVGLCLIALAGFGALGVWQLQRLEWKEALLARVERHLRAEPVPAPAASGWSALRPEQDEYRRIQLQGRFDHEREVLVRASTALGMGYWVMTPLRTDAGWVLVNRGFVPPQLHRQVPQGESAGRLVGLLRFSEPGGNLLQDNVASEGRWYSRDVAAIAAAAGLQGPVAPYFVDLQAAPGTEAAWPRPGLTVLQFPNSHRAYAVTWFALAALAAAALAWLLVDARRRRDGAIALGHDGA